MVIAPGTRVGGYEIVEQIGAGGMGQVYKARDLQLDRFVAIKIVAPDPHGDRELRTRLHREARAAAAVDHPHICTLYHLGQHQEFEFLVFQYLEGETLAARIARSPIPIDEMIAIGTDVTDALAAAHRAGLVHRDLKPSNIMLTAGGARLLDFGIASIGIDATLQSLARASAGTVTQPAQLLGTLGYMAPEQLQHHTVDARADVFAFGAVAYEMLTGRRAFERGSVAETIAAILDGAFVPLKTARRDIPVPLARIVARCLAANPERRWQTAADLGSALRAIANPVPQRAVSRAGQSSTSPATDAVRSLVVLPFEVADSEETQHYLADGLTDSLTDSIALVARVKLISAASANRFRSSAQSAQEIGAQLGVDGIVRGSVVVSGGSIRVQVSLVRARDGATIWRDHYERPMTDLFDMQWQIAETIAAELNLRVRGTDRRRARRAPQSEANQAYLQGRHLWNRDTPDALRRSFKHLSNAVQRDPGYAPFHTGLADWYLSAGNNGLLPASEAIAKAKISALRGRELDPNLADAYACLGRVAMQECDLKRAGAEFDNALRLNPNLLEALVWSAHVLSYLGMHQDAIVRIALAKQLDPVSPRPYVAAATIRYIAEDYERAIDESRAALDLAPGRPTALYYMGLAQFRAGRTEEALPSLESAAANSDRHPAPLAALIIVLSAAGRQHDALQILDEMKERATRAQISPYYFAEAYLGLGDPAKSLDYLRRSQELHVPDLIGIAVDPLFQSLRGAAEFQQILDEVLARSIRDSHAPTQDAC